jgi:hypothetical protein
MYFKYIGYTEKWVWTLVETESSTIQLLYVRYVTTFDHVRLGYEEITSRLNSGNVFYQIYLKIQLLQYNS